MLDQIFIGIFSLYLLGFNCQEFPLFCLEEHVLLFQYSRSHLNLTRSKRLQMLQLVGFLANLDLNEE